MTIKRKEYVLEGLNCAHCAAKIENEIKEIPYVTHTVLNFMTKTLIIEEENVANAKAIFERVEKIIHRHEPQIKILEKQKNIPLAHSKDILDNQLNSKINLIGKKKLRMERNGNLITSTEGLRINQLIAFITGVAIFAVALILELGLWLEFTLFFISYLLIGREVVFKALRNIARGQIFDENFLMFIATVGAFAIREFPEAVAVMMFYQIGEFFQERAVNSSRRSISALMDIRPDYANLKEGDKDRKVSPEEIQAGQIIIIKPGEKVPLDGIVLEGRSVLDTSALTGEFVPREVEVGSTILAGFINRSGLLTVKVTKGYGQSTVARILDLVENASSKKAPTENFITKFARYYTPAVVLGAAMLAILPPIFLPGATFAEWIHRALVFLVVSCPCALVISIPLSFFGGIGGASRSGILIKGSNYLEALNSVRTVVFDKTGTLTEGVFEVTRVCSRGEMTKDELLEKAALVESYSSHPIATSIIRSYGRGVDKSQIREYQEIPGHGVKAIVNGKNIIAGSSRLMEEENVLFEQVQETGTIVYIAIDSLYAGYIVIADRVRLDTPLALQGLRKAGVQKIVMLTGDNKEVGERIGQELGFDEVYAELLPDQKVLILEELEKQKESGTKLAFIGDGINDAPVLARADIGIAMGGLGSDAAIEAADIVLMTDEPSKILGAVKIAQRTRKIVWQNIIFALGIKAGVLLMGALGVATMWEAVFADVGVALIAILNAMRVLKFDNNLEIQR